MKPISQVVAVAVLTSCLTAVVTYLIVSRYVVDVWEEQAQYGLGYVDVDPIIDADRAEMEVRESLLIAEVLDSEKTDGLLWWACTQLTHSLPELRPSYYADESPGRYAEANRLLDQGHKLLKKLTDQGHCTVQCQDGRLAPPKFNCESE